MSWGLKGKLRDRAEAYYHLEGEALERRLADIEKEGVEHALTHLAIDLKYGKIDQYQHDCMCIDARYRDDGEITRSYRDRERLKVDLAHEKIDTYTYEMGMLTCEPVNHESVEFKSRLLETQLRYGKISQYDFDVETAKLVHPENSVELKIRLLEIDFAAGKVKRHEYEKSVATLRDEPYVGVVDSEFDPNLKLNGLYFSLDWNEQFVKMLVSHGYTGITDEMIVNKWFDAICRSITDDEEEGTDGFVANASASHVRIFRREDGKTEIS